MNKKTLNITIALAGIFQASALVKAYAYTGQCDETAFASCIQSLLDLNPNDITQVYGDISHLTLGLRTLIEFFNGKAGARDKDITRYMVSLLILQHKLRKNPDMLKKINNRIPFVNTQVQHFHLTHPTVIANLADIYVNTLSALKPRIHVQGARTYLEQEAGLNKVRALLFAGIRAAILWQQVGGQLYQLFLFRQRYIQTAQQLLDQITLEATQS